MSIADQIRQFIAETILFSENGFDYSDDTSFLDEGIIDSTGVVELVLFVEETYSLLWTMTTLCPTISIR